MYYCDPRWHGGSASFDDLAPATFFIRPPDLEAGPMAPSFAACEEHAGRAMREMMTTHGYTSVVARDVSGRAELLAERERRAG